MVSTAASSVATADSHEPHLYLANDTSEVVIGADFKDGDLIPDAVKAKILGAKPELKKALNVSTLSHASEDVINETAKLYGVDPSQINAYADGTVIYVPAGEGVRLGSLSHEVTHVHQHLTVPNFTHKYTQKYHSGLERGLTPLQAYKFNIYEMEARRFSREVLRANGY